MPNSQLLEAVERRRKLPPDERLRQHIEAIPRHVANSMAMEGEPVDEAWIRERLVRRIRQLGLAKTQAKSTAGPVVPRRRAGGAASDGRPAGQRSIGCAPRVHAAAPEQGQRPSRP